MTQGGHHLLFKHSITKHTLDRLHEAVRLHSMLQNNVYTDSEQTFIDPGLESELLVKTEKKTDEDELKPKYILLLSQLYPY